MERLLRIASPLGLFAEEFDVDTGRHLGNFPQAFSHLALIEAAGRIIAAELAESPDGVHDDDHGTSAGGGSRPAPRSSGSGFSCSNAATDHASRRTGRCRTFVDNRYISAHLVRRRPQGVQRRSTTSSAVRPSSTQTI
jgi:hypothetical protein